MKRATANTGISTSASKSFTRTRTEDLLGYSGQRAIDLVSWREVQRVSVQRGEMVFCRRGTGETGWWHDHKDDKDYGGNPMDERPDGTLECRRCGVIWQSPQRGSRRS